MFFYKTAKVSYDISTSEIKEKARSARFIKYEYNTFYIDKLLEKRHFPSVAESVYALLALDTLISEMPEKDRSLLPEKITLLRDEAGKPHIKDSEADISLSHTSGLAAAALSTSGRIGIDAEKIYEKDPVPLAARFFTASERDLVMSNGCPPLKFTEIWTKKEAYLKYLGSGLSVPLSSFDVSAPEMPHFTVLREGDVIITVCLS